MNIELMITMSEEEVTRLEAEYEEAKRLEQTLENNYMNQRRTRLTIGNNIEFLKDTIRGLKVILEYKK